MSAAAEPSSSWVASPRAAWLVRATVAVAPILIAWFVVRASSSYFYAPAGWLGVVIWIVQAIIVAAATSSAAARLFRRALPLATLLGMALTFPDQAPSRFSVALRTRTVSRMAHEIEDARANGLGSDAQEAATKAISLVTALGRHERLTRGHSERVRAYADLIAVEIDLSDAERQRLAWGVLLHDIGKLRVPAEILAKPGSLGLQEWEILKTHPAAGGELLAPLADWLGEWGLAASQHHERWDGSGYPAGLDGRRISLAGRITSVADAYDVMTSARSYKTPQSVAAARQELVRCSGTQFDPTVVRAFLEVSLDHRRSWGFLAPLVEVPRIAQAALSSASAPFAGAALAVAAVTATAPMLPISAAADTAFADSDTEAPLAYWTNDAQLELFDATTTTVGEAGRPSSTTTAVTTTTVAAPLPSIAPAASSPSTTVKPLTDPTTSVPPSPTPPTSTPAPTAPTTTTSSTTDLPSLYLTNPGTGDSGRHQVLPLAAARPSGSLLPNYDTDHDDQPGLLLHTNESQVWEWTVPADARIAGRPQVRLFATAVGGDGRGQNFEVSSTLALCSPQCVPFADGRWRGRSIDGRFDAVDLRFGQADIVLPAGSTLRLTVSNTGTRAHAADFVLAYDTEAHDAHVRVS